MAVDSLFPLVALVAFGEPTAQEMLAKVDKYRNPWPAFACEVAIQDGKNESRWCVKMRGNGDSRVDGLSDKEKGRAVLMLGDDMWMTLPNAKKPIKVSPQQRLLGGAAGGDIAKMRFAKDYTVQSKQNVAFECVTACLLHLKANRSGASFRTVKLWVAREGGHPLRAEYYLLSGKLGRTVTFDAPVSEKGVMVIPALSIREHKGAEMRLRFSHWDASPLSDSLFAIPRQDRPGAPF